MIGVDGTVEEAEALSHPHNSYSRAAVEQAKQWKFVPARVEGQPRKTVLVLPIRFDH